MVQGGMTCVKYLMFVFNFVFVICGIALIAVGAVVQGQNFTVFLNNKYVTAPTILIAVGVIIFVLAFLGCFGSVRENHCMVMTFGILLFIVFVVEIAGGITAYVYRNQLETVLKKNMESSIEQGKKDFVKLWDDMQSEWKCCGVNGSDTYPTVPKENTTLPDSCCPHKTDPGMCDKKNTGPEDTPYKRGCYKELLHRVNNAIGMVGGVAIGIGVIELIGVMFSCCLASAIKKEYEGV